MYRTDEEIKHELSVLKAKYTRFTDGLDVSFRADCDSEIVAKVVEDRLERLNLQVNQKKREKNGWQPIGTERIMCGVCVNSPVGTQLPRAVVAKLIAGCESLYRGARSVAPHTLIGLARRRRSLQGWLNQSSQADIAPIRDLQRRFGKLITSLHTRSESSRFTQNANGIQKEMASMRRPNSLQFGTDVAGSMDERSPSRSTCYVGTG